MTTLAGHVTLWPLLVLLLHWYPHLVTLLYLIWRWDAHRFHLWLPHFQMHCSDLTRTRGYHDTDTNNGYQVTCRSITSLSHWLNLEFPCPISPHHHLHIDSHPYSINWPQMDKILLKLDWFWQRQHGTHFNTLFSGIGIPITKIRWSWDHLIFVMEIPIPVTWHLHTETVPCFCLHFVH